VHQRISTGTGDLLLPARSTRKTISPSPGIALADPHIHRATAVPSQLSYYNDLATTSAVVLVSLSP
jgi:hypothetical protein